EVMFTYDATAKILFSADAFGSFGSISNIMDNESGYCEEYIQEMRRYYTNIVGKYGIQVKMALSKASALDIKYICPLHGLVLCSHIGEVITKYLLWAEYKAEDNDGVLVVYASMYGHTKALAYSVATTLAERGVATQVYDVSETDVSYLIAESFKFRKIALLSVTYNNRLYPKMKQVLDDFVALNNQNKVFALAENGSWAPCAIKEMKEIIALAKNCSINSETITIKSSPTDKTELDITNFVDAIIKA
ncbi:MAG: flavodoxin domain-containing protein, partial [Clostridia bacterium]